MLNRKLPKRAAAWLALAAFAGWSTLAPAADLPAIGDSTDSVLSTEQEQRLGEAFMRNIRQSLEIVDDPEVQTYIQSLGSRLIANSGVWGRQFTFFVVKDPTINAFAGPGGYIGVDTGLVLTTASESELASVLAHEIAHVTQRHLARAFEAASHMSLPVTAAIIAAIILGNKSGQMGQAALAATAAGSIQKQINFTRSNEQEADRVGLQLLAASDFDPRAMPSFFERMQRAGQYYENRQMEFLYTHPVTSARIADTRNRAEQYPTVEDKPSRNYQLIRAKLRILQDDDALKSVNYFEQELKHDDGANQEALRYGYALALYRAERFDAARAQIERLAAADPECIAYQIVLADVEKSTGHFDKSLRIYERNLDLYPYYLPLTLGYAEALLQDGQAEKARQLLYDYLRRRQPVPDVYRLLAQAESASDRAADAHQALAEYNYLLGQTRSAIEQLQIALRSVAEGDAHREAKIRARLDTLENEWREESQREKKEQ